MTHITIKREVLEQALAALINCTKQDDSDYAALDALRTALEQRIKELEADAKRYRWLREHNVDSYLACGKLEQLDTAIDRAMSVAALDKMREMAEELKLP